MFKNIRHRRFIFRILMDIHEYTLWEVGYCGSLQDIANILEYPQEQVLFSGYYDVNNNNLWILQKKKIEVSDSAYMRLVTYQNT